jgi:hypothetical protein
MEIGWIVVMEKMTVGKKVGEWVVMSDLLVLKTVDMMVGSLGLRKAE